jgi:hypothetical protein
MLRKFITILTVQNKGGQKKHHTMVFDPTAPFFARFATSRILSSS